MASGGALSDASSAEVVSAYSAPNQIVVAVAAEPGWQVIGAFPLDLACDASVDAIALVSDPALTCTIRLFDLQTNQEVGGTRCSTNSTTSKRFGSGQVSLSGGRSYQFQAECIGALGVAEFAVVQTCQLR